MEGTMSDASRASSRRWRTGVIMDPIAGIATYKDSTFAMLLEAQRRGHEIRYMEPVDLTVQDGRALGRMAPLEVRDNADDWFTLGAAENRELAELDFLLMRKDPPFDMEYVYTTYILERAQLAGALIVNAPQALRDMNEKAYTAWFPELTPTTLITRSMGEMKAFLAEHEHVVAKPLDGMGGRSIFRVRAGDPNTGVIIETLTDHGRLPRCFAQRRRARAIY